MSDPLEQFIADRLTKCGVPSTPTVVAGCAEYFRLLKRWNARVNLTALPLQEPLSAHTIDKLLVEPLLAAPYIQTGSPVWLDLGSGGGSPALPLRIARPDGFLSLVESRDRKCAFLREAVRVLNLARTEVLQTRFESLQLGPALADLVTVRAVRLDAATQNLIAGLLRPSALLLSFGTAASDRRFELKGSASLPDGSSLYVYGRMFHVEQ